MEADRKRHKICQMELGKCRGGLRWGTDGQVGMGMGRGVETEGSWELGMPIANRAWVHL